MIGAEFPLLVFRHSRDVSPAVSRCGGSRLCMAAFKAVDGAADDGNVLAPELATYISGQGVALIDSVRSARTVVEEFKLDFTDSVGKLMRASNA